MTYCDTAASFVMGRLACASPDRTGIPAIDGTLLLDLFTQPFGFLAQSSRFVACLLRLQFQCFHFCRRHPSRSAGFGSLDHAIAGFDVLVVSPDRFTRDLPRVFVVTPNVRDGLHCDFLRAAMTDVLSEQHDEQPDNGDRGPETVLEVWIPDLIQELLLALFPDRTVIGVIRIDLAQRSFVPGLACLRAAGLPVHVAEHDAARNNVRKQTRRFISLVPSDAADAGTVQRSPDS